MAPVNAPRRWPNSWESSMSFGHAAAVEGEEGGAGARRVGVNRPREHLLAGARFAGNQHRHVGRRDAAGGGEQLAHLLGKKQGAGFLLNGRRRPERRAAPLVLARLFQRDCRAADAEDVREKDGLCGISGNRTCEPNVSLPIQAKG